jgi:AcrR family transcriptional regulator
MAEAATSSPQRPPGRLALKKSRTRAAILAAAERQFSEKGFDDTAVQEIAAEADIGAGTVYGYFESKEEILRAIVSQHQAEAAASWPLAARPGIPTLDLILLVCGRLIEYVKGHRNLLRGAFVLELRGVKTMSVTADWLHARLRDLITEGIQRGELRPVPADTCARVLVNAYLFAAVGIGLWEGNEDDPQTFTDLNQVVRGMLAPLPR